MNEPAAVDYLLTKHPEWIKPYDLFETHFAAMTLVAQDLSDFCGLTVYADRIWTGGGCLGLGMVFTGVSMGDEVRTPEDSEKLKKLEQQLVDLKLVKTPELEILSSATYPPHYNEPFHISMQDSPAPFGAGEIAHLLGLRREECKRQRQSNLKRKPQGREEEDSKVR